MAGCGWGATVLGVFLPFDVAVEYLQEFGGAGEIPNDPMLNYWMRRAAGAFAIIGCLFLLCAWQPDRFAIILPIMGVLNLGEGFLRLSYGTYLDLDWFLFGPDVAIGIAPGIGILLLHSVLDERDV